LIRASPPHVAHLGRRLELSHRLLDAQPEQLIVELLLAVAQLVDRQLADFRSSAVS
jgi:hypothetical protein